MPSRSSVDDACEPHRAEPKPEQSIPSGSSPKRLVLLNLGGTIATEVQNPLDHVQYPFTGARLTAAQLLSRLSDALPAWSHHRIACRELQTGSSLTVGPEQWLRLRSALRTLQSAADRPDGVVVTHGTSTLEETAFFLALTLPAGDTAVVLTGAQRPLGVLGSDALLSLHHALLVAAEQDARGRGVMFCHAGRIWSARHLLKVANYLPAAFASTSGYTLGQVLPDHIVRFDVRPDPVRRQPVLADLPDTATLPRVDIVPVHAGADAVFIDAAVQAGVAGLVIDGAPPGLATPAQWAALEPLIRSGMPVVFCSRAHQDPVRPVAAQRDGLGAICVSSLTARQARVFLMVALGCGWTAERIEGCLREEAC